jgi:hypothetical protein
MIRSAVFLAQTARDNVQKRTWNARANSEDNERPSVREKAHDECRTLRKDVI